MLDFLCPDEISKIALKNPFCFALEFEENGSSGCCDHDVYAGRLNISRPLIKKSKTCTVFLSSYRNTSGSFGRTRKAFFEFSQTFTSVSTTRLKLFQKTPQKGKELVDCDYQNVNSPCSRHHYVNSPLQFRVSIELYKHDFQPISARAFLGLFSNFLLDGALNIRKVHRNAFQRCCGLLQQYLRFNVRYTEEIIKSDATAHTLLQNVDHFSVFWLAYK